MFQWLVKITIVTSALSITSEKAYAEEMWEKVLFLHIEKTLNKKNQENPLIRYKLEETNFTPPSSSFEGPITFDTSQLIKKIDEKKIIHQKPTDVDFGLQSIKTGQVKKISARIKVSIEQTSLLLIASVERGSFVRRQDIIKKWTSQEKRDHLIQDIEEIKDLVLKNKKTKELFLQVLCSSSYRNKKRFSCPICFKQNGITLRGMAKALGNGYKKQKLSVFVPQQKKDGGYRC